MLNALEKSTNNMINNINDIVAHVHVLRYCYTSCYNCLCYYTVNGLLKHVNNLNKLQNEN